MTDPQSCKLPADFDLAAAIAAISQEFPAFTPTYVMANGFDNVAIISPTHVFRFPRHETARSRLINEAGLLSLIRSYVDMTVPDLKLHDGLLLFSSHRLIPGRTLGATEYSALDDRRRDELACTLAGLYVQLHSVPLDIAMSFGATMVAELPNADDLLAQTLPLLPKAWHDWAKRVVAAWQSLPLEDDTVFSWFDGHGWNMAFDRKQGRLNGVFDFADAGIGPPHWDLQHTNLIHPDLTRRMIAYYQELSGNKVNSDRIDILTSVHRLSDYASSYNHPDFAELTRNLLKEWMMRSRGR
ncbi:phosphotransferase [Paracoccus sp. 11-3]|uniref:Phosphotransferase n=1 Tax=Paracoccus amoyensis TaxID=2760093 RepID=A0A926JDP8_9RHOB|nr:aminoglycoside phosphotransferase family protein [Paracoccus amoyensis]MBC9247914.1 phosphotransferase [Paracoccus amoyensis]